MIILGAAAVIIGVAAGAAIGLRLASPHSTGALSARYLPAAGRDIVPAPDFSLTDQNGQTVTLSQLRGHTVLITFMDPRCTSMCPIVGQEIAAVQRNLPAANSPVLVVISVASDRTVTDVQHFASNVAWRPGWHWLLGSNAQLSPVWAAYHIAVEAAPGDVHHDQSVYVIDSHGMIIAGYAAPIPVAAVTTAIENSTSR